MVFLNTFFLSFSSTCHGVSTEEQIDNIIQSALEQYSTAGIAVGVVKGGELIYSKGFGYRDIERKLPVTDETEFPVGSITKNITSFLIAQLVEEGLLEWDAPIQRYLPNIRLTSSIPTE